MAGEARRRNRRHTTTPGEAREWIRVLIEAASGATALGLLIWQGAFVSDPSALIVGACFTLLTGIAGFRIEDVFRAKRNGNGDTERWTHLP